MQYFPPKNPDNWTKSSQAIIAPIHLQSMIGWVAENKIEQHLKKQGGQIPWREAESTSKLIKKTIWNYMKTVTARSWWVPGSDLIRALVIPNIGQLAGQPGDSRQRDSINLSR